MAKEYKNDPKTVEEVRLAGLRFMRKLTLDQSLAEDIVSQTITYCLGHHDPTVVLRWPYVRKALLSNFRVHYRNKRELEADFSADGEAHEIVAVTYPNQEMWLILSDIEVGLAALPESTAAIIRLVAVGFEKDEVAAQLCIPVTEVTWRLRAGRRILRDKGFWNDDREYGNMHVGIRRRAHRWAARIKVDGNTVHLGSFATAAEAAKAYQEAVIRFEGRARRDGRGVPRAKRRHENDDIGLALAA
jgi:DNA-directed RNA polymerase specialized sigma24 family protein